MNEKTYYFDVNALLKLTLFVEYKAAKGEIEQGVDVIRDLVKNTENPILISEWTLLETIAKITKTARQEIFGKTTKQKLAGIDKIISQIKSLTELNKIKMISVNEQIYHTAIEMVQSNTLFDLSANDALHIAIVEHLQNNVLMVSSDRVLINVCQSRNIPLFNPENKST